MNEHRPWPLVLMTAIGAWIAAIPLIAIAGMVFGQALNSATVTIVLGSVVVAAATGILRNDHDHSFMEEMAVPFLLAGGALLTAGLLKALPGRVALGCVCLIVVGVAVQVQRPWLRVILGALSAIAAHLALASIAAALLWIASAAMLAGPLRQWADRTESVAAGWCVGVLLALSAGAGTTFLAGAALATGGGATRMLPVDQAVSLAMGAGAAALLLACWKSLRQAWAMAAAAVVVALTYTIVPLGAVLLVLAACLLTGRTRLAIACGVAAAWVIGAYYYQLNMLLYQKALILAGAGAVLGGLAWAGSAGSRLAAATRVATVELNRYQHGLLITSMAAVLMAANIGISQKEELIRTGQPVFIKLAPADPRSLMQGDYMRLNFAMPSIDRLYADRHRAKVLARLDDRGIATLHAYDREHTLAPNEILVELVNTGSGLRLGTDAWFFKEGEGERWAKARYGEFRIDSQGRTLLVDLRGENLDRL
jgi:uncharacterized membrane-anchored protein